MKLLKSKTKLLIFIVIFLFSIIIYLYSVVGSIVSEGYDKQNKTIEFVKSIIPSHYIKKIKDNLFIASNLKAKNKILELQLKKYEQGYEGQKFDTRTVKLNDTNYEVNSFFLPFKRLDVNLGWNAEMNSLRAHYAEINDDNIFLISGEGKTIFFNKNNLQSNKLDFKILPNNISLILKDNNFQLIGIRDLYFHGDEIFISMMTKDENGITINIYVADLNFENLKFEIFFQTNEYWNKYNVFSGGRIERFDNENILFSIGYSYVKNAAQEVNSLLGKIIKINLDSKKSKIISIGHRNPQGLKYIKDENLIINSEHGPKGGDEINFNKLDEGKKTKNFGWDIASYGTKYDGTDPYKKSHSKYGFEEPIKYYVPSIGISEVLYLENNSFCMKKCLWTTSLRANSIYVSSINKNFDQLIPEGRIFLKGNRIRDIDYDKELDQIILVSENIPSLLSLRRIEK